MQAPGSASRLGDGRGAGGELDEASLADLLETLSARRTRKFLLMVEEECANLVRLYHVTSFQQPDRLCTFQSHVVAMSSGV